MVSLKKCIIKRLYHGTSLDNIECIIKEGLKSPCQLNKQPHEGYLQEQDLIWFTNNKEFARHHARKHGKGIIVRADVEICNTLPFSSIGEKNAQKFRDNCDNLPCDEYVKKNYCENVDKDQDGIDAIVDIAIRCGNKIGELIRFLDFGSIMQIINRGLPERMLPVVNYAVPDDTDITIIDGEVID